MAQKKSSSASLCASFFLFVPIRKLEMASHQPFRTETDVSMGGQYGPLKQRGLGKTTIRISIRIGRARVGARNCHGD